MKILHTADWHAGKLLARQSRIAELRGVLDEIVDIARREAVDAVIVAGDLFDQKSPTPEAERLVYNTLLGFETLGIPVVLVAGNHDHPQRWNALTPLLERFNTHVVSQVSASDSGGIISIETKSGERLQIAALPWVPLRPIIGGQALMGNTSTHGTYADQVRGLMQDLCKALDPDACRVFVGHMSVEGAIPGGGERTLTLGQVYGVDRQDFPNVQYVALGHVHRPQDVGTVAMPARYSGSPLQLDFGEVGYSTSVTIVELTAGLPADVREVALTRGRALRDVTGTLEELAEQSESLGDAFLRVTLRCLRPEPGLGEQVKALLPNALQVHLDYPRTVEMTETRSLRAIPVREQFSRYLEDRHGVQADDEELNLFEQLLAEVDGVAD